MFTSTNCTRCGFFVKDFFGSFFIQHDRPEHAGMRKVVHHYFNPKSMETWRPMVVEVIH